MFKIGVDGHNLEQSRAGVARAMLEELRGLSKLPIVRENIKFHLYFKAGVPKDRLLEDPIFEKKVLPHIVRPSSAVFYNVMLPWQASKDKLDLCYFPGYMLPLLYEGRSVVTIHDVVYEAHPNWFSPYYRYSYHLLSGHASRKSSAIVTISEFSKREIVKYYNVPTEKIWVIPLAPAVYFRKIADEEKIREIKNKYGVKKDFILFVAQIFVRRHAYEAMLAFERLAKDFPDLQFLVVGRDLTYPAMHIDDLAETINQRIGRPGIIRKKYIELDEDLAALYSGAKLFTYLSEYEGFGLPPIESLACGTPPILADTEVSREVFGSAAFYIKNPKDPIEIADRMASAITNKEQIAAVLENAPAQLAKYSWDNHCQKLLDLFRLILNF